MSFLVVLKKLYKSYIKVLTMILIKCYYIGVALRQEFFEN